MNKDRLLMHLDTIEIALGSCARIVEWLPHRDADLLDAWTAICEIRGVSEGHKARSWMRRHLNSIEEKHPYKHPVANVGQLHPLARTLFHKTG